MVLLATLPKLPIPPLLAPMTTSATIPARVVSPPDAALPLPFHPEELGAAFDYAERAEAPATTRAYRSDVAVFSAWCAARRLSACPAAPPTVAVFLADEARRGVKPATLSRRLAAIRADHVAAQLEPPTGAA